MTDNISFVLERFNAMLASDGAGVEIESIEEGVLRLRYLPGPEGVCETCVLDPTDLEALIGEALVGKGSDLAKVEVLL